MRFVVIFCVACQQPSATTPAEQPPRPIPGRGPEDTVPAAPPSSSCDDAPLLSLQQVASGDRAGERIAFDAVPRASIACTLLACMTASEDGKIHEQPDACCNKCGGSYGVEIGLEFKLRFEGIVGFCGGYDCNLRCEPFGWKPTHAYRFVGVSAWSKRRDNGAIYDKSTFTVEKFCLAPQPAAP